MERCGHERRLAATRLRQRVRQSHTGVETTPPNRPQHHHPVRRRRRSDGHGPGQIRPEQHRTGGRYARQSANHPHVRLDLGREGSQTGERNPLLVRRQKGRHQLEGLQGATRHENQRTRLLSDPQRGETAWHDSRHAVRRPQHGGPDRHELQPNIHAARRPARPHPRHRENRHGHTHRRRHRLLDAQQPRPDREPERGRIQHAMAAMVRQSRHPPARIREQRETRPDLQRRHVPSRHVRRKRRLSGRRHRRHPERRQPVHSRRNTAHRQTGRADQRGRQR